MGVSWDVFVCAYVCMTSVCTLPCTRVIPSIVSTIAGLRYESTRGGVSYCITLELRKLQQTRGPGVSATELRLP